MTRRLLVARANCEKAPGTLSARGFTLAGLWASEREGSSDRSRRTAEEILGSGLFAGGGRGAVESPFAHDGGVASRTGVRAGTRVCRTCGRGAGSRERTGKSVCPSVWTRTVLRPMALRLLETPPI